MAAASSKPKTLIYNWVEERQCEPLETGNRNPDGTLCTNLHRVGHKGLLSVHSDSSTMETATTSGVSYTPSVHSDEFKELRGGGEGGKRENKLKKELYKLVESELEEEIVKAMPPPFDFKTVTKQDFMASGFIPQEKEQVHNFEDDSATFWRHNIHSITGVSPVVDSSSPFKRNTAFSTPIEQRLYDN
ncbi:PREDICTED: sperm-associated antigen 8-like [Amphimedon queenslandica]|uniref:Sperm-associated antigen 8 n=1 Tax=Amphimedon queenslandica TaxID=400682 RepID=A0A1X7VT61_AMPQE|nr:PREDICTED: sperm-associated antigen 8-like [Amphimedon queenslandica]|eukprot:XP_011406275.1 PREDICTED: sperm-associated antigen 8-like [Amphimedon queenslandica]